MTCIKYGYCFCIIINRLGRISDVPHTLQSIASSLTPINSVIEFNEDGMLAHMFTNSTCKLSAHTPF